MDKLQFLIFIDEYGIFEFHNSPVGEGVPVRKKMCAKFLFTFMN